MFVQLLFQWQKLNITYTECVFVALGIQPALRMYHMTICGLYGSTMFSTLTQNTARFSKKKMSAKFLFRFPLQLLSEIQGY